MPEWATAPGFGYVTIYEIGDVGIPFTIQSISKAFVFALALETFGPERVADVMGVEPSGDAFNSIRLRADNRPFNPMVNSGAIACSAMIYQAEGEGAGERVREVLGRFAGRDLGVDEAVFASERLTGDRNRAIAWDMLRARLFEREMKKREAKAEAEQAAKTDIGWGHQIRSYVLQPYQMVKDLRTDVETSDTDGVLDGDLDQFMAASLAQRVGATREA